MSSLSKKIKLFRCLWKKINLFWRQWSWMAEIDMLSFSQIQKQRKVMQKHVWKINFRSHGDWQKQKILLSFRTASYSFIYQAKKKKHFNLGNWRSQVAWLVFWTSSSLEKAGMSKTCGYSFIEIRNNQISGPTVVWAPLPSVRSNQPASFIFQERASQFTCFYQLSVLKWKIRGLNLSSSYRITLLMYNMPNSKR